MRLTNKTKNVGQLLIDLTPLLDVIFLMLIVVLSYQSNYSNKAEEVYDQAQQIEQDAKDMVADAESKKAVAQEQLDTYEKLDNYVNVITIYASYTPSNIKYRTLHVQINSEDIWEKEINPSNEKRVWEECQNYLESKLTNDSEIPTIFSIMDEKMLYRDEQEIYSLYGRLNIQNKYEKNNMEMIDE